MPPLSVLGHMLDVELVAPAEAGLPTVVFLHEGLGSRGLWRDFPARFRDRTGLGTLVYSRWGYGESDARAGAWPVSFMHDEAIAVLPALLRETGVHAPPILFGHSDGGSIALIFASHYPAEVRAVITEAAHVIVEDRTVNSITEAAQRFASGDLRPRLARYHATNTDTLFAGWSGVWLRPEFRQWDLRPLLPGVRCPVLAIQGYEDEYGTMAQLDAIAGACRGPTTLLRLDHCAHAPHAHRPDAVLDAAAGFLRRITGPSSSAPPWAGASQSPPARSSPAPGSRSRPARD